MGEFDNLHQILLSLYEEMMPLCSDMAGVAKGLAGLGALFYVAMRVWQSLARAEAIDVYPLLRPFAIGLCILFFPTIVLGTMNSVLGVIVQGTHSILEEQTFDMEKYREQKDRLEYEAMMRNPETAYLASDEEFDRQIDELGWSPSDMITMTGMYMDRAAYNIKKSVRDWFREVQPLHTDLPVAARLRPVQHDTGEDTDTDAPERHRGDAGRPELLGRGEQRGVHRVPRYRYRGILHHPDGSRMDNPGRWRSGQLQQEHRYCGRPWRQSGRCGSRKRSGTHGQVYQKTGRTAAEKKIA